RRVQPVLEVVDEAGRTPGGRRVRGVEHGTHLAPPPAPSSVPSDRRRPPLTATVATLMALSAEWKAGAVGTGTRAAIFLSHGRVTAPVAQRLLRSPVWMQSTARSPSSPEDRAASAAGSPWPWAGPAPSWW